MNDSIDQAAGVTDKTGQNIAGRASQAKARQPRDTPLIGCVQHDCAHCKRRKRTERRALKDAIAFAQGVYKFMRYLDTEFANAPRTEQFERLAISTSNLEMFADMFAHFSLDISLKRLGNWKSPRMARAAIAKATGEQFRGS